jgi:predicted ABC-type ATPase
MPELKPTLTIVAGPNGSGKSTYTRAIRESLGVPVIDPDWEARLVRPDAPQAAAVEGGKQAIKRARAYLVNNQSFAAETTLAGKTYLRMMAEAKQKGWLIDLIYVGVASVETSIDRVAQRVAQGGHNVPEEDIRRRYTRSLANLPIAIELADRATILDNSTAAGHQPIAIVENGRVVEQVRELPEWIKTLLPEFTEEN